MTREPKDRPKPIPMRAMAATDGRRIFVEGAHEAKREQRHRDRKGRVLRVDEHMPVIERAGRQQRDREQAGDRPAEAAGDAPGR